MTVISPDVEVAINAIKDIAPRYNLTDGLLETCVADAILAYSKDASAICIGKNSDFRMGVLLTLHLHQLGALPEIK